MASPPRSCCSSPASRREPTLHPFALAAALSAAFSNVFAGTASRRAHPSFVLVFSAPAALLGVAIAAIVVGGAPSARGLVIGALAGVIVGVALPITFIALGTGPIGTVTATMAASSTLVATLAGIVQGEQPTVMRIVALVLCLVSIVLVTSTPGAPTLASVAGPLIGVVAGALFGSFSIVLDLVADEPGLWPLTAARVVVVVMVVAYWLVVRRTAGYAPPPAGVGVPLVVLALGAGIFDLGSNLFLLAALQVTSLGMVALAASLSPAIATILSWLVLREGLRPIQLIGLAVAVAGTALAGF